MAVINRYDSSSALAAGTRTNLPGTNYTNPSNRRLLVTDIWVDSSDANGTRIWLEDLTTGVDLHSMYLAAAGSLHRSFTIPIEISDAHQIGIDAEQVTGTTLMSAGWSGKNENP